MSVKLNVSVSKQIKRRMDYLVGAAGHDNMAEMVRAAFSVYDQLVRHELAGGRIIIEGGGEETHVLRLTKRNDGSTIREERP